MGEHRKKTRRDAADIARSIVEQVIKEKRTGEPLDKPTGETEPDTRNPAAVAMSRLRVSQGGKARSKSLGPKKTPSNSQKGGQSPVESTPKRGLTGLYLIS